MVQKGTRLVGFLLLVLVASTGCQDEGTDDVDAGELARGFSKVVKARAYISNDFLDECRDARVYRITGPDSHAPDDDGNIDARPVGIVRQSSHGECIVEIEIESRDDAALGHYEIEVLFSYFVEADPFEYETSGFVTVEVVDEPPM